MTQKYEVYKCGICGNVIEVLHSGQGELVCCGQPMRLLEEQTAEQAKEKHVPVIEQTAKGIKVKVGSVPHPMEEKHYIEWIEIITNQGACKKFLKPGDPPEAEFEEVQGLQKAREYCNIHDLWKYEK
ncbi:MAG: Desulfoferrodoxin [candidate division TA06 bacterium 34_109]|jgi:superoxide reductase|uniref:Desulfoferrodoxin n=1 Tax=candidate division TA06 bacterium 34_109 TaxID=1635277 RepID=A0A101I0Q3_UNCT6|nr:MAG: Desulfoferrodoxin [candidate division TA06 bacterium 34_109]